MTDVKFCGMTRVEDVREGVRLGAAFIGAIMTDSPRRVSASHARNLFESLEGTAVQGVGVFGNEPPDLIIESARVAGVDVIQLHGDEHGNEATEQLRAELGLPIWRVIRVGPQGFSGVQRGLANGADAVLLDTLTSRALGGSGETFPWNAVEDDLREMRSSSRIILAGGLRPENVRAAIELLQPDVVDVSSGVESQPGIKDHSRMAAFMNAVRLTSTPSAP